MLYVRKRTMAMIPKVRGWQRFATKLQLAARLMEWIVPILKTVHGQTTTKTYKTFLATYAPVGGVIRVVLVKEDHGWYAFFCTDPNAGAQEILEAFADRRPSHADRRKALRRGILRNELSTTTHTWSLPQTTIDLAQSLVALAT